MPEFRIQRCLGRGGFGEVYKGLMARKGGVEVDVAIKVLRPDLDPSSQGVQRLRDEGRLLGRLTHPTILRVYDLVVIQERAALVTEYIPGQDLGPLMGGDDGIPARAVFEVVAQVAAALDAAWSWPSVTDGKPLQLVHRDIKPDNIRIDPHGVVKLLDFGIAQAQAVKREAHTSVNTIMGSTQYLAPERMVQQEVGPEADVFALGCTLYEALTGQALFIRKSMRQMYMLMVDERKFDKFVEDRCDSLRESLPNERAASLIRAMTAYRKTDRPTASEVAARCDAIGDSLKGRTLGQWCRNREWPPPPEMSGPLDGLRFTSAQPLVDPKAETLALKAPASQARTRANATPAPSPRTIGSEDPTLEPGDLRPPVLGEAGPGPQSSAEKQLRADRVAKEGPLPWSTAEMLALFSDEADEGKVEPDAETVIRQAAPGLGDEGQSTEEIEPQQGESITEVIEVPRGLPDTDLGPPEGTPHKAPFARMLAPARVEDGEETGETTLEVPESADNLEVTQPVPRGSDATVELPAEAQERTVSGLGDVGQLPVVTATDPGEGATDTGETTEDPRDVQTEKLDSDAVQRVVDDLADDLPQAETSDAGPSEAETSEAGPPQPEASQPEPEPEPEGEVPAAAEAAPTSAESPSSEPEPEAAEEAVPAAAAPEATTTPAVEPSEADTHVEPAVPTEPPMPQGPQRAAEAEPVAGDDGVASSPVVPAPSPDGIDTEVAAPLDGLALPREPTADDDTDLGPELIPDGDTQEAPEDTAESSSGPPSVGEIELGPPVSVVGEQPESGPRPQPEGRRRRRSQGLSLSPLLALFSGVAGIGAGLALFVVALVLLWVLVG